MREFILAAALTPPIAMYIWGAGFGTTALLSDIEVVRKASEYAPLANLLIFEHFPMGALISWGVILSLLLSLITSLNSATYTLGVVTSDGKPSPKQRVMFLWAVIPAAISMVLISSRDGLAIL